MTENLTARLAGLARAMAAPLPSPEELAAAKAEDRAIAERICKARPGIPLHHAYAVLDTLRTIQRVEAAKAETERDGAYRERAQLLALLAQHYPSVLTPAAFDDTGEDGWEILYLVLPTGQASWHIHPRDLALFATVPSVPPGDELAHWDGHSTEEKYERIAKLVTQLAPRYKETT